MHNSYSWSEWIHFFSYIILGFFGTIGNIFILYVIFKNKMKSTTFTLVANQAVSDLSCGLLYISLWLACSSRVLNTIGGNIICDVLYTLKVSTFFVSVYTMMFIAIERFKKLYYPHSRKNLRPAYGIVLIWILGLITSCVCIVHFRGAEFFTEDRLVGCREAWSRIFPQVNPFFSLHYNILAVILIGAVVPIFITAILYFKVIQFVKNRENQQNHMQTPSKRNQSRNRTTEMLIYTLVFYVCLCSPLDLAFVVHYVIVYILPEPCDSHVNEPWYFLLAYFLSVLSICINPLIYSWFNQKFRDEAKYIYLKICRKEGDTSQVISQKTQSSISN